VTPAPHTADEVADSFFAGAGALTPFIHESLLNTASPVCNRLKRIYKRAQRGHFYAEAHGRLVGDPIESRPDRVCLDL
jgi:hypothetical protein